MTKLELHPKGKSANYLADELIASFAIDENIHCEKTTYLNFGVIETLLITIGGGITTNLINKLIEKLLDKKIERKIEIKIYHIESKSEYIIPEELQKFTDFVEIQKEDELKK